MIGFLVIDDVCGDDDVEEVVDIIGCEYYVDGFRFSFCEFV